MAPVGRGSILIIGPSLKPWYNYLDRLAASPSPQTLASLNSIVDMAKASTSINTHVITGKLRASVRSKTNHIQGPRTNRWEGSVGIGLGVPYAKYETGERRRGTRPDWLVHPSHDPYDGLEVYYAGVDAVLRAIG